MDNVFLNSKWIALQDEALPDGSCLFRKEFKIHKDIVSAELNICGLGIGIYSFNGKEITDAVLAPFTAYDKTVIYESFDLSDRIKKGENCIGVHLGNGFYNNRCDGWGFSGAVWRDMPKLIAELIICYTDGTSEMIVTDTSWKCCDGPVIYNHMREGEIFDARLVQAGFDTAGFNDTKWKNALICRGAGGAFRRMEMPPERIIRTIKGSCLGGGIYDFGENMSGWVRICVKGKKGSSVTIEYSERLAYNEIDNENINAFNGSAKLRHSDRYILSGSGEECYNPRFVYHGFRYVKVTASAELLSIDACVVHTDLKTIGSFECGNEMINKIHRAALRSILTNYHSVPTDCPHREQNGWTADAHISAEPAMMNFDMESAYLKWLNDFRDMQRPDGQLPSIIPTPRSGYRAWGGPAWESAVIIIPYTIYKMSGKTEAIRRNFDIMNHYLQFLKKMSEGYIVGYGLGDWCHPKSSPMCDIRITDTAYFYLDAAIMAECAELMCRPSNEYRELAKNIKTAFHKMFLNSKEIQNQTGLAVAAGMGLLDREQEKAAAEKLAQLVAENKNSVDCGILGNKYIYRVLSRNGYAELAFRMITNPNPPSYAFWIEQGMTTLCENWDMSASQNHHMFSEADMWFYQFLAGIRLDGKKITIEPVFIETVGWVRAKHRDISVEWDDTSIKVSVPRDAEVVIGGKRFFVERGEHSWNRKHFESRNNLG